MFKHVCPICYHAGLKPVLGLWELATQEDWAHFTPTPTFGPLIAYLKTIQDYARLCPRCLTIIRPKVKWYGKQREALPGFEIEELPTILPPLTPHPEQDF